MSFQPKVKEPLLSEETQNMLYRSMGDVEGYKSADSMDVFRYKYKIMQALLKNKDLLASLHDPDHDPASHEFNGDEYRNRNIFDYMKLPDLKDRVKNYICFEVNIQKMREGAVVDTKIVFRTVSHADDSRTDWGISRHDLMAEIISKQFDWSNMFGMHIEKHSDYGYTTNDGYYYREILYRATTPNNLYNKINNR